MSGVVDSAIFGPKEFRRMLGGSRADAVRESLRDICNAALHNGLTRAQVADTLTELGTSHPDLTPDVLIDSLSDQIGDLEHEEWSREGFRGVLPDQADATLPKLRSICNAAIRRGMSRGDVTDVLSRQPAIVSPSELSMALGLPCERT